MKDVPNEECQKNKQEILLKAEYERVNSKAFIDESLQIITNIRKKPNLKKIANLPIHRRKRGRPYKHIDDLYANDPSVDIEKEYQRASLLKPTLNI